jgi:16S rRNA (cytidine1402-2'-O)-methyltransferase
MSSSAPSAPGTLFLVGTPIGNLGDMSDRARATLATVDLVAAEDTRRTGKLLAHFGIRAKTVSLFEGNERERTTELVAQLRTGLSVAVVSDAGMPGLSDPGFRLVRACAEEHIDVQVVPGPSAVVSALVVSGLSSARFSFEGFLARRPGERRARLESLATDQRTLVFFESPRRVAGTLEELAILFGDRRVAIVRELTKMHEEILRGRISELLADLRKRDLKGEVVLVVEGASEPRPPAMADLVAETQVLIEGGMRKREAAGEIAKEYGVSANEIYDALIAAGPGRPAP